MAECREHISIGKAQIDDINVRRLGTTISDIKEQSCNKIPSKVIDDRPYIFYDAKRSFHMIRQRIECHMHCTDVLPMQITFYVQTKKAVDNTILISTLEDILEVFLGKNTFFVTLNVDKVAVFETSNWDVKITYFRYSVKTMRTTRSTTSVIGTECHSYCVGWHIYKASIGNIEPFDILRRGRAIAETCYSCCIERQDLYSTTAVDI